MTTMNQKDVDDLKLHRRIGTELLVRLNDQFRQSIANDAVVMLSEKVAALPESGLIPRLVREFDRFDGAHNVHDVGYFDWHGEKLVWKIDCYDNNGVWLSWADPSMTYVVRGLTVMLVEEF